jgi:hypothetical protein
MSMTELGSDFRTVGTEPPKYCFFLPLHHHVVCSFGYSFELM